MQQQTHFITEATFEKLLGARLFIRFGEQLLFFHQQMNKHVIATIDPEADYTTNDYFQLPEGVPYQLINKKLVFMPAPNLNHQEISMNLATLLRVYLWENNLGKVFAAPTDVEFDDENAFQPDVLFVSVARKSILQETRIKGAPDFVVEILSKGTADVDRTKKMTIYGQYDVIEYWIVSPAGKFIEVYHNFDHQMQLVQTATENDCIVSKAIEGFELEVGKVFG